MREEFALSVDYALSEQLTKHQITIEQFVQAAIGEKNSKSHQEMCSRLLAYHLEDGGSPVIADFDISNIKYNAENLKGSFKTDFNIMRTYVCSAVSNLAKDTITWDFKVSHELKTIIFTGEEQWQRDAD